MMPNFILITLAFALAACSTLTEKSSVTFNTALVKQIKVQISSDDSTSRTASVIKNLSAWGYPIATHDTQSPSHLLTAKLGTIEQSQTPTGFSFSAGNSDPRALEFQKANVLPVSCELRAIAQPEQSVYLQMDFVADTSSEAKLIDHISTVCFNLLSELKWSEKTPLQTLADDKVRWMPEVHIETINEETVGTEQEKLLGQKVTRSSDGRKQIIIHNQGSPVILQFGHERR